MKARRVSLKVVVNEAIRAGLVPLVQHAGEDGTRFRTRTFDGGRCLIGSLDSVGEVLAVLGPQHTADFSRFPSLRWENPLR